MESCTAVWTLVGAFDPSLVVGVISGVVAALAVLASRRIYLWWLDNHSCWPFEAGD